MSGATTKRMIRAYQQMAQPMLFLSGLFQSPPENFHTSEEVEIDIVRSDEDISIVIEDLSTGYRINGLTKIERKIRRSIEVQASQVLQTGVVTLTDINGAALYTLDYKPKATHFPTAGTAWGTAGDDPVGDINALAEVIRGDGLADPDQLLMGVDAFEAFIKNSDVQKRFDTRRFDLGTIAPMQMRGNGGSYRGTVEIGNYRYDVWTYGGRYKDPQTGVSTPYLDPSKVVVRASSGRLDATFGAIPNIGALMGTTANQLLPELPGRLSNAAGGMDLFTNAWTSQDGEQLFGGVGARPLMIPTAIDTFGCLETNA